MSEGKREVIIYCKTEGCYVIAEVDALEAAPAIPDCPNDSGHEVDQYLGMVNI